MKHPNRREIQSFLLTRTQGKGVFLLTLFGVDEAPEIRDKNLHSRPFHFILKNTTKGHIFHKEQIYVGRSIIREYIYVLLNAKLIKLSFKSSLNHP